MIDYELTSRARKDIEKLSPEVAERIIKKLDYFVSMSNPLAYADHLNNYELGSYRFRIGDYRAVFDVEADKIVILKIGHRREIYK